MKKYLTVPNILYAAFMLVFFAASCVFTADVIAKGTNVIPLLQCLAGLALLQVPFLLKKLLRSPFPALLVSSYHLFVFGAMFLGEVCEFYYKVRHWDVFLHFFSAMMSTAFAFILLYCLTRKEKSVFSPLTVCLFAFVFSLAVGALWEMFEFGMDGVFGLNMQKFRLADGTVLSGHEAVSDSMKDLIVDGGGALVASVAGYFSLRFKKGWAHHIFHKDDPDNK